MLLNSLILDDERVFFIVCTYLFDQLVYVKQYTVGK